MFGKHRKDRDAVQVIIDDRLGKLPHGTTPAITTPVDIAGKALAALEQKRQDDARKAREAISGATHSANMAWAKIVDREDYIPLEWTKSANNFDIISNYEVTEGVRLQYNTAKDELFVINPYRVARHVRINTLADLGKIIEGVQNGTAW